ncbi:KAP family P-loop NTPase fold protein [Vibrio brasiliensis]|uniref:KAP P-loop domain-containing protein n=1 Tax=Vibrio brasiliensis LMG 20546 TaxID=945543 RepID=E8LZM6_9VIBR|nr:KAP family NTPase [Vibrio brasiliensis]EGA63911.1 KAP P-loop domain-containing protein [Vibrio brasiliensis LMG 20546]
MPESIIEFNWKEPTPDKKFPADTLDRARYASFLHNYLINNSIEGGYVLNLNAKWGAGKTYFINRWIESIKVSHPVVYIDAWKQDYSDDPMLTVVSSLIGSLGGHLPKENQRIAKISEKSARFIKALAPVLMKGVVKKATGVNLDDISLDADDSLSPPKTVETDGEQKGSGTSDIVADSASTLAKCMIDDHNAKLQSVEHLRNEISQLVEAITKPNTDLSTPTFVFIDELDRCRPSYAVEMLEVVKHFFELDSIVFVIATDTEQLQHAVKAVYGEGFDAQTYLGRFFRRRYSLTELSRYEFVQQMVEGKVTYNSQWQKHVPSINQLSDLTSVISIVADRFRLSLRDTAQLVDKFLSVLSNANKTMNPYLLLILFVLREKHYFLYEKWMEETYKNKDFGQDISNLGYNTGSFPMSFERTDEGFLPGERVTPNGMVVRFPLQSILNDMHKFCSPWKNREKTDFINQLARQSEQNAAWEHRVKCHMQEVLVELSASKADYKNWVELAVSFDE